VHDTIQTVSIRMGKVSQAIVSNNLSFYPVLLIPVPSKMVIKLAFGDAGSLSSSVSLHDRVAALYDAATILSRFSLSWCQPHKIALNEIEEDTFGISSQYSVGSEEYRQILRVRLCVDDIAHRIVESKTLVASELDLSLLINLLWSLAILGLHDSELLRVVQARISIQISSKCDTEQTIRLLFAEATFFHDKSGMDLQLDDDTLNSIPIHLVINSLFSFSLFGPRMKSMISRTKKCLVNRILNESKVEKSTVCFAVRALMFGGDDVQHELSKIKSMYPDFSKEINRPAWKYSFQLCLTCHAVVSRGIEINPVVDNAFPFDAVYAPARSGKKRRVVFELLKRTSIIRDIMTDQLVGLDGYTRMTRKYLSGKGYRIVVITTNDWASLNGDVDLQMRFVKRRLKNALRQSRLYTGMERDASIEEESNGSSSDADSDMSY
jgi:hypothetical protein